MATRLYSIKPEQASFQIVEAVGSAVVTSAIELTVDFGALAGYTPAMSDSQAKMMVCDALEKLRDYVATHSWPPA
jgi:hypothetical protein